MIGESSRPRLAGIRPAPLCREDDRRKILSQKMLSASSLPSLARLGMFKSINDPKSRFIHKHMRAANDLARASQEGGVPGVTSPLPRHWGGPPKFPSAKVSEPLAVLATEAALEDFRRDQGVERNRGQSGRGRWDTDNPARQRRSGASTSAIRRPRPLQQSELDSQNRNHYSQHLHHNRHRRHPRKNHQHQQQHQQQQQQPRRRHRPPSTHAVVLSKGRGLVLVGEDGIRKSKFPRGCERFPGSEGAATKRAEAYPESSTVGSGPEGDVLTRLCDPKNFTGTAATGQLPTVVDLEGGVGVLLKGDSTALKDRIGADEVSWRLRLAERL